MNKLKIYVLSSSIAVISLFLLSPSANAQQSHRIIGQVVDQKSNPVPNVKVKIYRGAERLGSQNTDKDGRYAIDFRDGGPVTLVLYESMDYHPASIRNIAGTRDHTITKVIYSKNSPLSEDAVSEIRATIDYINSNPDRFPEERARYAQLQDELLNSAKKPLTGTFRLDRLQSDDARRAADQATRDLPYSDRLRVYDQLVARLESPDMLAIERNGPNITIASTRSPQITFEADGREQIEQTATGRTIRTVVTLNGNQLSVTTTGNRNTDFNVTFDPIEGGRRLRVTRRLSSDRLNRTVEVQSVYDRTSDVAQWNVYGGSSGYPTNNFIIPNGTQVLAVLNTNLNTRDLREGDRFTMTVRSPSQYDGATIEGYVSNIDRGGRISGRSEMTLNFETIRNPRDNRTYNFAGLLQSVRTPSGETISVNNEGSVREDSRTSTTAKRAAIGTAVGALIGAIAGGGKGAAVGAAVGAGAGAGSVYVQGRNDINLTTGTEVQILTAGPR